jgi:hypothetical protein
MSELNNDVANSRNSYHRLLCHSLHRSTFNQHNQNNKNSIAMGVTVKSPFRG